jgi:hypothetical protein
MVVIEKVQSRTILFSFAMHATMTALPRRLTKRPVGPFGWSESASPCHYLPAFGAIGTASFFDEDDWLPEDDFPQPASNVEG